MKYSNVEYKRNCRWRRKELAAAFFVAITLSACSDGETTETGDGNNTNTVDINTVEAGVSSRFPSPAFDSGPESLIVTGIEGNDEAISPWFANFRTFKLNSRLATTGDVDLGLLKYRDNFPAFRYVEFYEKDLDTCEINDPDAPPSFGGDDDDDNPPPLVSGGESVVINTPSGTWVTVDQSIEDGELTYMLDNELPAELLPEGATLSIPGDEFPTVAAYPLYDPEPPVRLLPDADMPVTADSAFSWIPGIGKTHIRITFLAYDEDDDFVDFAGGCDARDDGSFTMPAEVTDFLSTTPYRIQARYSRNYSRIDFIDGVAFRQRNRVAE